MDKGDYFRWSYNEETRDRLVDKDRAGTLYWCCARIARFNGERLVDIYSSYEPRSWSLEKAEKELDLVFLANENDIVKTNIPDHYDESDVIILNHPNSSRGNEYIKKTASKSREAMRKLAYKKLNDAKQELNSALSSIELYSKKVQEIEMSETLENIWV